MCVCASVRVWDRRCCPMRGASRGDRRRNSSSRRSPPAEQKPSVTDSNRALVSTVAWQTRPGTHGCRRADHSRRERQRRRRRCCGRPTGLQPLRGGGQRRVRLFRAGPGLNHPRRPGGPPRFLLPEPRTIRVEHADARAKADESGAPARRGAIPLSTLRGRSTAAPEIGV